MKVISIVEASNISKVFLSDFGLGRLFYKTRFVRAFHYCHCGSGNLLSDALVFQVFFALIYFCVSFTCVLAGCFFVGGLPFRTLLLFSESSLVTVREAFGCKYLAKVRNLAAYRSCLAGVMRF